MHKAMVLEFTSITPFWEKARVEFGYTVYFEDGSIQNLTEKLFLPDPVTVSDEKREAIEHALRALHIILGISYYKLYCPTEISIIGYSLDREQAEFWNTVYTKGLGEFFYKNNIDFHSLVNFPHRDSSAAPQNDNVRGGEEEIGRLGGADEKRGGGEEGRSLVLIGGGKDSIVSGELLKQAGKPFDTLYSYPLHENTIEIMGVDGLKLTRQLDPQLFKLNNLPFTQNGHIPITAIWSFGAILVALLYDYQNVILSNERSANYGNVEYLGEEINHQWSKSFECETMISAYVKEYITDEISYFSLLRPFYEIKIVELFTKYEQYFHVFSSCNRNFIRVGEVPKGIKPSRTDNLWCGHCPKCAFVFCLLAAFISKEKLISIFGKNVYEDESLLKTYRELLGVENVKPFECVGTPEETKVALFMSHERGEFEGTPVMEYFEKEILPVLKNIEEMKKEVFSYSDDENIPEGFRKVVHT